MIYLTLLVSDLPVIPVDTNAQKIYLRFEQQVDDTVLLMPADEVKEYFVSVREVLEQDLKERQLKREAAEVSEIKSTPPLASEPAPDSSD